MADARWKWPARFAAHSPANAELLDRLQAWKSGIYRTERVSYADFNLWEMVGCLALNASADEYDGKWGFAPSPSAEEQIAIDLIEELVEAADRFEAETGWAIPLPAVPPVASAGDRRSSCTFSPR